jgi:hypothetical protein
MCTRRILVPIPNFFTEGKDYHFFDEKHPEYGINRKGQRCFRLDACIVPLIKALWAGGFKTRGCCCGHDKSFLRIGVQWRSSLWVLDQYDHPFYCKCKRNPKSL